jgi:hypothetical protein
VLLLRMLQHQNLGAMGGRPRQRAQAGHLRALAAHAHSAAQGGWSVHAGMVARLLRLPVAPHSAGLAMSGWSCLLELAAAIAFQSIHRSQRSLCP